MISKDNNDLNQNLYIRKLNGLGEKITVRDSLRVSELKEQIKSLKSLQTIGIDSRDFNLIFKGKNISEKSESTLRELNIPSDGIIHLVFVNQDEKRSHVLKLSSIQNSNTNNNPNFINNNANKLQMTRSQIFTMPNQFQGLPSVHQTRPIPSQLTLRVFFNNEQHLFTYNLSDYTVLDLKKAIALKLNLIYESIVLSHLGTQMIDQKPLRQYKLENYTLLSVNFNINIPSKQDKKKLQTRMVSSVTFSDENNEPNKGQTSQLQKPQLKINNYANTNFNNGQFSINNNGRSLFDPLNKLTSSSNSIPSDSNSEEHVIGSKLTSFIMNNNNNVNKNSSMYKSEINTFGSSQGVSKAALMFKNALHQKINETESVVSGQFSQQASLSGADPNTLSVTVKNEQETKQFIFQCLKTHQILNIKEKLLEIQGIVNADRFQISLEEDLFQSIDLNKSGCVTLNQIVKKMGKQRAVFIYRII